MPPDVTERWSGRGDYVRGVKASRAWDVDGAQNEEEVRAAVPEGGQNQPHPMDSRLLGVTEPTVKYTGPASWLVSQSYQLPPNGSFNAVDKDPLDRPPKFLWRSGRTEDPSAHDANGKIIKNAAGVLFDPPPSLARIHRFLTVTRWESTYDLAKAETFENTTNKTPLNIPLTPGPVAPGRVLLLSYTPLEAYDEDAKRVPVQYEFELWRGTIKDDDGLWDSFKFRLHNAGYLAWFNAAPTPTPSPTPTPTPAPIPTKGYIVMNDGKGNWVTPPNPVPLDSQGQIIDTKSFKVLNQKTGERVDSIAAPAAEQIDDPKLIEQDGQHYFLKFAKAVPQDWTGLNIFKAVGS